MNRRYLMTPGPSPVPSFIREAYSREMMHHRTSEFVEILKQVNEGMKYVFCTQNPVLTLASSGTGAMEAAVSNLFSFKDKVIAICGGKFGERWLEIGKAYGLDVVQMDIAWGTSPTAQDLIKVLDANKGVKGVLTTLVETSTATVFDIASLAKVAQERNVLLVVDGISGVGQEQIKPDEWGVDVLVTGSQKGLMLPPGLAFISLSPKAQEAMKTSNLPKYYFSMAKALKAYAGNDTPYTPAVSLIMGLVEAINYIKLNGIENLWQRYSKMAQATREAGKAIGLSVYSKNPSNSVTAFYAPAGMKAKDIVKKMRKDYGISIAAGQGDIEEKIIRIAHMGWINEQDLVMCFSVLEKALKDLGHQFKLGASVARLQEVIYG